MPVATFPYPEYAPGTAYQCPNTIVPLPMPPQVVVNAPYASPDPCTSYVVNNVMRNLYINEAIPSNQLTRQMYKTTGNTYPYPYAVKPPRAVAVPLNRGTSVYPNMITSSQYNSNPTKYGIN